jgi:cytochrome c-type biogenesis protein CcmF
MSWKRGDLMGALQRLWAAAAIAALAGTLTLALMGGKALASLGIALGTWLVCGAVVELFDRIKFGQVPLNQALKRLKGLQRSALGMTLAHLGMGIFVIGAVSEVAFRIEHTATMGLGETTQFAGRTVTLKSVTAGEGPNYYTDRAEIALNDGKQTIILTPEKRFYPAARMATTEVAIKSSAGGDLYAALGDPAEVNGRTAWTVRLYWNPMIILIFGGAFMMALGGLVSLSDRRLRVGAPQPARKKTEAVALPNAVAAE